MCGPLRIRSFSWVVPLFFAAVVVGTLTPAGNTYSRRSEERFQDGTVASTQKAPALHYERPETAFEFQTVVAVHLVVDADVLDQREEAVAPNHCIGPGRPRFVVDLSFELYALQGSQLLGSLGHLFQGLQFVAAAFAQLRLL